MDWGKFDFEYRYEIPIPALTQAIVSAEASKESDHGPRSSL